MKRVLCIDDKRRSNERPGKPMPVIGDEYIVEEISNLARDVNNHIITGVFYYIPSLAPTQGKFRPLYQADRFIDADEPVEENVEAKPQLETA